LFLPDDGIHRHRTLFPHNTRTHKLNPPPSTNPPAPAPERGRPPTNPAPPPPDPAVADAERRGARPLAARDAAYSNGVSIPIDGGTLAWRGTVDQLG